LAIADTPHESILPPEGRPHVDFCQELRTPGGYERTASTRDFRSLFVWFGGSILKAFQHFDSLVDTIGEVLQGVTQLRAEHIRRLGFPKIPHWPPNSSELMPHLIPPERQVSVSVIGPKKSTAPQKQKPVCGTIFSEYIPVFYRK
jgi:hypothetical protein